MFWYIIGVFITFLCILVVWLTRPFHACNQEVTGLDGVKLRFICGLAHVVHTVLFAVCNWLPIDGCKVMNYIDIPLLKDEPIYFDGIPIFVYDGSHDNDNSLCMIFIHGGGFAYSHYLMYRILLRKLAVKLKCRIYSINYRLAPSHQFPCAHDDCYIASKYILNNTSHLGINKHKIIIAGDSAGGNLTASTCLRLCQDKTLKVLPKAQILLSPWLQCIDYSLPSHKDEQYYIPLVGRTLFSYFAASFLAGNSKKYSYFFRSIDLITLKEASLSSATDLLKDRLKRIANNKDVPNRLVEALTSPYMNLFLASNIPDTFPPVHMLATKFDVLYSENVLFHEKLLQQGKQSILYTYPTVHVGFLDAEFTNISGSKHNLQEFISIARNIFYSD